MAGEHLEALGSGTICQIAVVVRDIERSAKTYADLLGVDVPGYHLTGPEEETNIRYRGRPTPGRAKLAFLQMGNISLELIEPVGGPSIWQEYLDANGEGVHHIAFRIKGMDEHVTMLEDKGMPVVQTGDYKGGRYSYVDSAAKLGVLLELLESYP